MTESFVDFCVVFVCFFFLIAQPETSEEAATNLLTKNANRHEMPRDSGAVGDEPAPPNSLSFDKISCVKVLGLREVSRFLISTRESFNWVLIQTDTFSVFGLKKRWGGGD